MCTLMMLRGWKLRYSTHAVNKTYCPDSIEEFIKQRRRWILSDLANSFLVFRNLPR
jgi:chitin synthase